MGRNAEFHGISVGPLSNGEFAIGGSRHAVFINRAHHHTGAVGARQLKNFEKALVAVLVVGGVQQALATSHLEAGLHLLPLRGVEHQRQVDVGDQTAHQLMHVLLAIAADVVDVDIKHVSIFFDLAPGNRHQAIPVFAVEQLAHLLGATGVEPLANDQKGIVLVIGRGAVNRGSRGFRPQQGALLLCLGRAHRAFGRGHLLGQLSQGPDMGWRGAAAATNHLNAEVFDEVVHRHLHLHWSQAVMGHTPHVFRQTGIGNATHHEGSVRAEVAHVLFHLLGARGAIEAQHINGEGFKNRHHSSDV